DVIDGAESPKTTHPVPAESLFSNHPYYQQLLVMLGGILFNLIFAYSTFTFIFMVGVPKTPLMYQKNAVPTILKIEEGSAAQQAGLRVGDTIIAVKDSSMREKLEIGGNVSKLMSFLEQHPNQVVRFTINRDQKIRKI